MVNAKDHQPRGLAQLIKNIDSQAGMRHIEPRTSHRRPSGRLSPVENNIQNESAMTKTDAPIQRYSKNPILTKAQIPYPVHTVHNAAAIKQGDKYLMLFRAHRSTGLSILGLAESQDGFNFNPRPTPFMVPCAEGDYARYEKSLEDPRVTLLDGVYYITYSCYSGLGVRIGLARTEDWQTVERLAMITPLGFRNCALFPEKFKGKYLALFRPNVTADGTTRAIWSAESSDLVHWGNWKELIRPVPYHWDGEYIGPGAPPFRFDKYYINIYHGVFPTAEGRVYRLGIALHDAEDPRRVVAVGNRWILTPEDLWEMIGYVHNVVFTCGAIPEEDGTVKIYWGGSDKVMCVGTAQINDLVRFCLEDSRPAL